MFAPKCPKDKGKTREGLFTIYETRDDKKKVEALILNGNSIETSVPEKVFETKRKGLKWFGKFFGK